MLNCRQICDKNAKTRNSPIKNINIVYPKYNFLFVLLIFRVKAGPVLSIFLDSPKNILHRREKELGI